MHATHLQTETRSRQLRLVRPEWLAGGGMSVAKMQNEIAILQTDVKHLVGANSEIKEDIKEIKAALVSVTLLSSKMRSLRRLTYFLGPFLLTAAVYIIRIDNRVGILESKAGQTKTEPQAKAPGTEDVVGEAPSYQALEFQLDVTEPLVQITTAEELKALLGNFRIAWVGELEDGKITEVTDVTGLTSVEANSVIVAAYEDRVVAGRNQKDISSLLQAHGVDVSLASLEREVPLEQPSVVLFQRNFSTKKSDRWHPVNPGVTNVSLWR